MNAFVFSIFIAAFSSGANTDPQSKQNDALARCRAAFEASPEDYEASRCFLEVGIREGHTAAQIEVDRLARKYPSAFYLDIIRAHFVRNHDAQAALDGYANAAQKFAAADNAEGEIIARANLRSLLVEKGEYAKAQAEVDKIKALGRASSNRVVQLRALVVASLHELRLHIDVGTAYAKLKSIRPAELSLLPYAVARELTLGRAGAALLHLDFAQATLDYQQLFDLANTRGDTGTRAIAKYGIAYVLQMQLEHEPERPLRADAIRAFEAAIEAAHAVGNIALEAQALESLAWILAGDPSQHRRALEYLERCTAITTVAKYPDYLGMCQTVEAQILAHIDPEAALRQAQSALHLLAQSGQLWQRIAAWRQVMRRSFEQWPHDDAKVVAKAGLSAIETLRQAQRSELSRRQIFSTWTTDYYWLASRFLQDGAKDPHAVAEAFSVIERARARVLLELASGTKDEPISETERLAMSTLEREVEAVLRTANNETERSAALAKIESHHQAWKQVHEDTDSSFAGLDDVQKKLDSSEAFILFQVGPNQSLEGEGLGGTWAIVVTRDKYVAVKLELDRSALSSAVRLFRGFVEQRRGGEESLLKGLKREIWEPIASQLASSIRRVIVSPDGALHAFPFAMLDEQRAFTVVPSASMWMQNRVSKIEAPVATGLVLVDPKLTDVEDNKPDARPWLAMRSGSTQDLTALRPLLASRSEADAIVESLGSQLQVLAGADASVQYLQALWKPAHTLLHVASHAQSHLDAPEQSALILAGGIDDEEGRLYANDLRMIDLSRALVVLSGCATGWGEITVGEGILSIARGFQQSGARAVVASLWPVEDSQAAAVMRRMYEYLGRGERIDDALLHSQQDFKAKGWPVAAYSSFVVIGSGDFRFVPQSRGLREVSYIVLLGVALWVGVRRMRKYRLR